MRPAGVDVSGLLLVSTILIGYDKKKTTVTVNAYRLTLTGMKALKMISLEI